MTADSAIIATTKRPARSSCHDDRLCDGGDPEHHQTDLDCADAHSAGLQRGVDAVGGVVAVGGEKV
jgi:hypothetical protein